MSEHQIKDEMRYTLLRYLEANPNASQRELAKAAGVSVGKINYCVRALIAKGWLKIRNFRQSTNKRAYIYVLTPKGIEGKVSLTREFLRIRTAEYQTLAAEIERLTEEVRALGISEQDVTPVEVSRR
jgi:MarR family transcriptional regulator, temperature-dependent positive regulator of motility